MCLVVPILNHTYNKIHDFEYSISRDERIEVPLVLTQNVPECFVQDLQKIEFRDILTATCTVNHRR